MAAFLELCLVESPICHTTKLLCSLTSLHSSVALVLKNLWEIWKVQPQTPVFIKCVDACEKTWSLDCQPLSGCLVPWKEWSLSLPLSWWRENQRKCLASAKASKIASPSKKAVLWEGRREPSKLQAHFLNEKHQRSDGHNQMLLSDTSSALLSWKLPEPSCHPSSSWAGDKSDHTAPFIQSWSWGSTGLPHQPGFILTFYLTVCQPSSQGEQLFTQRPVLLLRITYPALLKMGKSKQLLFRIIHWKNNV